MIGRQGEATRAREEVGRPARVVFWAGSFERAGTQRFLVELLSRIDRTRFDPVVFSTVPRGDLLPAIRALGVPVREFGTGRRALSPATVSSLARAALYLRRENVDILSCLLGIVTLFGPFVGRLAGVPVVVNNQRNLGSWIDRPGLRAVYAFVNRKLVDAVLVNSEAARDELSERFGVPVTKIVNIGAGIDLAAYARADHDERLAQELGLRGRRVVGIVAKLTRVKGHEHFLAAAAEVLRIRGDATFLIVGDGPRRQELEGTAVRLGIADKVVFAGARDDVPRLLGIMDVFVLSSISEGAPNALVEAMAAGVPVVATAVGGVRSIVTDGVTGVLVPPADPRAIAAAVLSLLNDPVRARGMGRAGRDRAREDHDIGQVVTNVEAILWGLFTDARARRKEKRRKETIVGLGRAGESGP